jgi:hypothetical protein
VIINNNIMPIHNFEIVILVREQKQQYQHKFCLLPMNQAGLIYFPFITIFASSIFFY